MAGDEDDFDDEYDPRKRSEPPRRTPVAVVVGLALVAAVIVGMGILLIARNRQAAEQAGLALAENDAALAAEKQKLLVAEKRRSNWDKVIGTWVRKPEPRDTSPYRFEFRNDKTALTIRMNPDGQPEQHEGRIEVLDDEAARLTLRMVGSRSTITYAFRFKPDGTLVLNSGDLLFTREK